ncbi:MAG TPA: cation diffusion facilitator family transporter [Egibacteraceae bacterium]|nr:cation diffusion facilitator family transporter [Egibacteraceae bacterium]
MSRGNAGHSHGHGHGHGHVHSALDRDLLTHRRAVRAVWVSAVGLGLTAAFQFAIVAVSGSAALFADALHNIGDVAGTASLWLAFSLSRRAASDEFSYGWRRAEDLAGLLIVLAILASAGLAGYDSLGALLGEHHEIVNLPWAFAAALVGIVGNEAVAQYKITVGRAIDSVPLVADGQHARVDGLASAAAAAGIVGVWLGYPLADPVAGLAITGAILWILRDVGRDVLRRAMDAVEPGTVPRLREVAGSVEGVVGVHDVRARYLGRSLAVQLHAEADPDLPLREAHAIAERVRHELVHAFPNMLSVDVHLDPAGEPAAHAGTDHHFGGHGEDDHPRDH